MKKLIAIAVVFALVAGVAFAVDLGASVDATINLVEGSSVKDSDVTTFGDFGALQLQGSGESGDGTFGGWIRFAPTNDDAWKATQGDKVKIASGVAWWKPIDQFKLAIGSNGGDGFWGKEGVTGWMFNQKANSKGFVENGGMWFGNGWGSSPWGNSIGPFHTRYTFFEGVVNNALMLEIKPLDMLGINIALPYLANSGATAEDMFKAVIAQVDLNFDFGNISFAFDGGGRAVTAFGDEGGIFVYYGGSFGDLSLDVGLSYHLAKDDGPAVPLGIGLGLKYASGDFGVKFRGTVALGGDKAQKDLTYVNVDVLPYYAFSDSVAAFFYAGLGLKAKDDDSAVGFFINPYLRIGAEWGPSFYVGFRLQSDGLTPKDADGEIKWAIPILLTVGF